MAAPKGNNNATRGRDFRDALHYVMVNYEDDPLARGGAIYRVAKALVDNAIDGDNTAIKEIADRIDGKPVQESHSSQDVNLNVTEHITIQEARERVAELIGSGTETSSEGVTTH